MELEQIIKEKHAHWFDARVFKSGLQVSSDKY